MDKTSPSLPAKFFPILITIGLLAASSLACEVPRSVFGVLFEAETFHLSEEEERLEEAYGIEIEDMVADDTPESVVEEEQSYGSVEDSSSGTDPDPAAAAVPSSEECGESGICVAVYPVDIRSTANPPDLMAFANAGEYPSPPGIQISYTENAGPWYEWLVLREPGDWVEASSGEGYSALGIQFWGDDTNGWASLLLDGVEVWRGDITTYGTDGVNYFVYVELTGQVSGAHTLRTEVLGLPGKAGGDNVPVFYFAYRE